MSALEFIRQINSVKYSKLEIEERITQTCQAIVSVLHPKQIYLFGSAVSGESYDEHSDIDCVAVLESEELARTSWKSFGKIRRQLHWSLDLVCFSETEFLRKKDLGGIAFVATHEGRLIYEATKTKS